MGFFDKIKAGLKKTRDSITGQINSMLHAFTKIDEELFEELEELLVMADVGMNTATEICDTLRARVKERGITDPNEIMTLLQEVVTEMVSGDNELHLDTQPSVILVIGVNGVGKTTTIGKLASRLKKEGKSVILGAADTDAIESVDYRLNTGKLFHELSFLEEREQLVLTMRYGLNRSRPMTQKEVADQLGISRSYVSRIEKKALERLQERFVLHTADGKK